MGGVRQRRGEVDSSGSGGGGGNSYCICIILCVVSVMQNNDSSPRGGKKQNLRSSYCLTQTKRGRSARFDAAEHQSRHPLARAHATYVRNTASKCRKTPLPTKPILHSAPGHWQGCIPFAPSSWAARNDDQPTAALRHERRRSE